MLKQPPCCRRISLRTIAPESSCNGPDSTGSGTFRSHTPVLAEFRLSVTGTAVMLRIPWLG